MRTKAFIVAAALVVMMNLFPVTAAGTNDTSTTTDVKIIDDLGREVLVPTHPERVASLIGSFADIWCLAGGLDSLVATANDTWTSFDLNLSDEVVNLGAVRDLDIEKLIASEPDLILASVSTALDVELLPSFEQLGYTVVYFEVSNFEEYLHMLDVCTQITGERDNYVRYGSEVRKQVDSATAMQDGSAPSVLYIRASSGSFSVKSSEGNVLGEMLADLGCRNIADGNSALLEALSLEAILVEDPDYIFLVYQAADPTDAQALLEASLLSNPAWAGLRAVREGRIYILDNQLYNLKPNAQWGTAYEQLAQILYGETDQ